MGRGIKMSTILSTELKQQIHDVKHEPTRVMGMTIDLLESALIDQQAFVLDPSQPLPFLIENDVVLTHAAVEAYEANTMRQYPVMAQNESDLYLHMSDADMVGMYASPGEGEFVFMMSKSEVLENSVSIPGSQSRKLTIPKHTEVQVNGLYFTMQYPIHIVIKPHGGIEISYDGTVFSPLQELSGTNIDWSILRLPTGVQGNLPNEYIRITMSMKQLRLTSYKDASSAVSLFKKSYKVEDQFCHARVFMQSASGWNEIGTTHSDHTFDPFKVTMQLKVIDNVLHVELPYVYQATQAATSSFRVDIYSTRGDVFMDLSGISGGFEVKFTDLDQTDGARYYSPLSRVETFAVIATGALDGGSDQPSFADRRARILNNTIGPASKPISPSQIQSTVEKLGFDITLNHDDAIGRTYQVSRSMPAHNYGLTTTPIDSAVMTAKSTIDDLIVLDTVKDNYDQITIMANTLYKDVGGMLVIVPDDERLALEAMTGDFKVNALTNDRYLYTPLHYVLDFAKSRVNSRPYYLTNPTMDIAGFSDSNDTIDLFVQSSSNIFIDYEDDGYLITVITESNDPYKELDEDKLVAQLAFKPDVENEWVYVNGTLVNTTEDGERMFQFKIGTDFVIRPNHQLALTNFTMRVDEIQSHDTPLNGEWFLIWGAVDYYIDGMSPSGVDDMLGTHLLPSDVTGIYRESIQIRLGDELTGLWRRSRPMVGTVGYKVWEYDVPLLYEANVYERNPDGTPVIEDVGSKKQLKVLHAKGDPVINEISGEPEILYRAGTAMRDEFDELIPENPRKVVYWWDMVLFDAQYRYATRALDADYSTSVANVLVEWVNETLKPIRDMALERTELSFHPRNSLKFINVLIDDGRLESIYTAQRFVVDLYLNPQSYREPDLREVLSNSTKKVLQEVITKTRVSKEDIISTLKTTLGEDVVTAKVSGLGAGDYQVISLLDTTTRLCVAKVLSVESDGKLSIKDDIIINFKRHGQ